MRWHLLKIMSPLNCIFAHYCNAVTQTDHTRQQQNTVLFDGAKHKKVRFYKYCDNLFFNCHTWKVSKKITYWQGDVCLNPYCSLHVQSWTQHWLWCVSAASGQFRLKRHLRWNCLLQSNAHVQQCEWLTEADVRPSLHFYVQQEKNSILWLISAPDAGLSVSFPSAMWFKQCSLTPTLSKSKGAHTHTHTHADI